MSFETLLVIYGAAYGVAIILLGISLDRAYLRDRKKFRDGESQ